MGSSKYGQPWCPPPVRPRRNRAAPFSSADWTLSRRAENRPHLTWETIPEAEIKDWRLNRLLVKCGPTCPAGFGFIGRCDNRMAIGADGAAPDRNEIRYGLALVLVMIITSGCASRVESPTFPTPVAGPQAVPLNLGTSVPLFSAVPVTDSAQEEPFDPFAKPGESDIDEYDPWEPLNTKVFEFNRQIDRWILKPVARAYNFIMPDPLQLGISNFFYNIRVTPRFVNNVAQGKVKEAGIEVGRFLINTTVGLAGFIDVAERLDLRTPEEDTGQTLGFYGMPPGPYLVLPLMQPFTVRDLAGYVGDIFLNPIYWLVLPIIEVDAIPSVVLHKDRVTTSLILVTARVTEVVNDRSLNLEKYQGVEEATLDLYSAVRNAYLQKRAKAIQE